MFSIGSISPSIIQPLRYYFSKYTQASNMYWNEDEKLRTLDISEAFDLNKIALGEKPRISVTRGGFSIDKTGVSDNLAEGKPAALTRGNKDTTNLVLYRGTAVVVVEARNKGTCELLSDMVAHFIVWTRPILCDELGWKEFGLPMMIGDCNLMNDEDVGVPKFQVQIQVPWIREEAWRVQTDGPELRAILHTITV